MSTLKYKDNYGKYQTIEYYEKTVEDVFNALAEDGFEHLRESWFAHKNGLVTGACVLGQAGINLQAFATNDDDYPLMGLFRSAVRDPLNSAAMTVVNQLDRFHLRKNSRWQDNELGDTGCGNAIVHWNDKKTDNGNYVLATYADVTNMALSILKPHFKKTVFLAAQKYDVAKPLEVAT